MEDRFQSERAQTVSPKFQGLIVGRANKVQARIGAHVADERPRIARNPIRAGRSLRSLQTLNALRTHRANEPLGTLRTGRARRAGITFVAFVALWALRPLWTGRTGGTSRSHRSRQALETLKSLRTGRTGRAGIALGTLRTGSTCRAGIAFGSLRSGRRQGIERVWRRVDRLPRRQRSKWAVPAGPRGDVQPISRAIEHAAAEVQARDK